METREERIKKAWSNHYSISHSKSMACGNMICDKCGKKIVGYYLIKDRTNYMLRGNENDERYLFHRRCSEENKKWVEFDREQKEMIANQKLIESQIKEVKELIQLYGLTADQLFEIDYYQY